MIAAGSLDPDVVRPLVRHPRLARRYLAIEGHRALVANADLLPRRAGVARRPRHRQPQRFARRIAEHCRPERGARRSAAGVRRHPRGARCWPPAARAAKQAEHETPGTSRAAAARRNWTELDDGEVDDTDDPDLFTSPVGGGGFIGKWLKKMLSSARKTGSGGGPPGADTPTHRTNSGEPRCATRCRRWPPRRARTSPTTRPTERRGVTYPEWDVNRRSYRPDWCTVREIEPTIKASATQAIDDAIGVRRPLARLGMGLHRRHRQPQGDDIDIDAAVEARVEVRAGSVPDEAVYLDSLRRRRDLSVLLLLDVSGSTAEAGTLGRTVHEQQRAAVANLTVALHDLGDRVALYAYYSQGRSAVSMVPVKRFDDHLDSPGDPAAEQPGTRRLLATRRRDPARLGGVGGARRHVATTAGGAVRRTGLRPRVRACLRCRGCAPRADRGTPPRHRLRLPDDRRGHRRGDRCAECSAAPRMPRSPGPINSPV